MRSESQFCISAHNPRCGCQGRVSTRGTCLTQCAEAASGTVAAAHPLPLLRLGHQTLVDAEVHPTSETRSTWFRALQQLRVALLRLLCHCGRECTVGQAREPLRVPCAAGADLVAFRFEDVSAEHGEDEQRPDETSGARTFCARAGRRRHDGCTRARAHTQRTLRHTRAATRGARAARHLAAAGRRRPRALALDTAQACDRTAERHQSSELWGKTRRSRRDSSGEQAACAGTRDTRERRHEVGSKQWRARAAAMGSSGSSEQ